MAGGPAIGTRLPARRFTAATRAGAETGACGPTAATKRASAAATSFTRPALPHVPILSALAVVAVSVTACFGTAAAADVSDARPRLYYGRDLAGLHSAYLDSDGTATSPALLMNGYFVLGVASDICAPQAAPSLYVTRLGHASLDAPEDQMHHLLDVDVQSGMWEAEVTVESASNKAVDASGGSASAAPAVDWVGGVYLYWIDGQLSTTPSSALYRAPIAQHADPTAWEQVLLGVVAFAADWHGGRIWAAQQSDTALYSLQPDGSNVVTECANIAGSVAVWNMMVGNFREGTLYAASFAPAVIYEVLLDGSCSSKVLVDPGVDGVGGLALGPQHEWLYYLVRGGSGGLRRYRFGYEVDELKIAGTDLWSIAVIGCTGGTHGSDCEFSYSDGVMNGRETGVDCGGPGACAPPCQAGSGCELDTDCASSLECKEGVCSCRDTTCGGLDCNFCYHTPLVAHESAGSCQHPRVPIVRLPAPAADRSLHLTLASPAGPWRDATVLYSHSGGSLVLGPMATAGLFEYVVAVQQCRSSRESVVEVPLMVNVTCPFDSNMASGSVNTPVAVTLQNMDVADHAAGLQEALALTLGTAPSSISVRSVPPTGSDSTEFAAHFFAPGSVQRTVSVVLDGKMAGSQGATPRRVRAAFSAAGRLVSRALDQCCTATAHAASFGALQLQDRSDMQVWWSFSDSLGNIVRDWSSNGCDAEPYGNAARMPVGLRLQGDAGVTCDALSGLDGDPSMTMMAWVRWARTTWADLSSLATIVGLYPSDSSDAKVMLHVSEGRLGVDWSGHGVRVAAGDSLTAGKWHHVAAVKRPGSKLGSTTLFIDGLAVDGTLESYSDGSFDDSAPAIVDGRVAVGKGYSSDDSWAFDFVGDISDVQVHSRAFTASQVLQTYSFSRYLHEEDGAVEPEDPVAPHGRTPSTGCPAGMSRLGSFCMDNDLKGPASAAAAMSDCHSRKAHICDPAEIATCDMEQPAGMDCTTATDSSSALIQTVSASLVPDGGDWGSMYHLFAGDNTANTVNKASVNHQYLCCRDYYDGMTGSGSTGPAGVGCPTGSVLVADTCIEDTPRPALRIAHAVPHGDSALVTCSTAGMQLCTAEALTACDVLEPNAGCNTATDSFVDTIHSARTVRWSSSDVLWQDSMTSVSGANQIETQTSDADNPIPYFCCSVHHATENEVPTATGCPNDMTQLGDSCIDNVPNSPATFPLAISTCAAKRARLCSFNHLVLCDYVAPSGSQCRTDTDAASVLQWILTADMASSGDVWPEAMAVQGFDNEVHIKPLDAEYQFYCCAPYWGEAV